MTAHLNVRLNPHAGNASASPYHGVTLSPLHLVTLGVLLTLVGAGGCAADADNGTVTGEVTLDGQPLKEGLVKFVSVEGPSQTADAPIADGRFRATVPLGKMRVQFHAPKVVGKQKMYDTPDSPTVDVVEELLPVRYNIQSEFTITVKSGSQHERYELKSK